MRSARINERKFCSIPKKAKAKTNTIKSNSNNNKNTQKQQKLVFFCIFFFWRTNDLGNKLERPLRKRLKQQTCCCSCNSSRAASRRVEWRFRLVQGDKINIGRLEISAWLFMANLCCTVCACLCVRCLCVPLGKVVCSTCIKLGQRKNKWRRCNTRWAAFLSAVSASCTAKEEDSKVDREQANKTDRQTRQYIKVIATGNFPYRLQNKFGKFLYNNFERYPSKNYLKFVFNLDPAEFQAKQIQDELGRADQRDNCCCWSIFNRNKL